jgi:hypothetical protein
MDEPISPFQRMQEQVLARYKALEGASAPYRVLAKHLQQKQRFLQALAESAQQRLAFATPLSLRRAGRAPQPNPLPPGLTPGPPAPLPKRRRGRKKAFLNFEHDYLVGFFRLKYALGRAPTRKEVWKECFEASGTFRTFMTYLADHAHLRFLT